jgi:hypothetical protein
MSTTGKSREQVTEQVASLGLTEESLFFRHTRPEFLEPLEEPGTYRISANADPSEAVIDVYAGAHTTLALHLGPGLAFAESPESEWRESGRTCVELRLQDVLDQGGRVYPVESVITERVWYFTLPEGGVRVRRVGDP